MSETQAASSRQKRDCARVEIPNASRVAPVATSAKRRAIETQPEETRRRVHHHFRTWILHGPADEGELPSPRSNPKRKSIDPEGANDLPRRHAPAWRSRALRRPERARVAEREEKSLAEQIRSFQERADLRECRLPGMLSRVSRQACEGWQRQTGLHSSQMLARIKLNPCTRCEHFLGSAKNPIGIRGKRGCGNGATQGE
jgi:hypothetical protein